MTVPSTYKLGYPPQKYSVVPCVSMEQDPTTSDLYHPTVGGFYPLPTIWINKTTDAVFVLTSITSGTSANWQPMVTPASGVVGPASATDNALARFDGTTGKLVQNSVGLLSDAGVLTGLTQVGIGIAPTSYLTLAAGTATAGTAPLKLTLGVNLTAPEAGAIEYDGSLLTYTNNGGTRLGLVAGPASTVDNAIARFDATTGKLIQTSAATMADTTGAITFPAGGGVIMTAGGAATRKGSATLVAGTVTVNTTSAVTGAVIVPVVTALGTVATTQGLRVSISNGVSFTVTSNDNTDTSTFSWAIVG